MQKMDGYKEVLKSKNDWIPFLKENSNLPGPRANLELVHAAAQTASIPIMETLLAEDNENPAENTPGVFVVVCGIVALGTHYHPDKPEFMLKLKQYANDPRWRVREGVAMALQEIGKRDMALLLAEMQSWLDGSFFELRAVAAGCCEPILLQQTQTAIIVLDILDHITARMLPGPGSDRDGYATLKKGLSYCWSVAVVHAHEHGKLLMEKWLRSEDNNIRNIMIENLKKNRLVKMDPEWVEKCLRLDEPSASILPD